MALNNYTNINTLTTAWGAADANLQATLATSGSATLAKLTLARQTILSNITESDFDNADTLLAAARAIELSLPTTVAPILNNVPKALAAYFKSQYNSTIKAYFKPNIVAGSFTWDSNFITFWRRAQAEELTQKLGTIINTAGTWGSLSMGASISLNTALEILVASNATTTVSMTVTAVLTTVAGQNQVCTITIPVGTPVGTTFALSNANATTFNGVSSFAVSGGSNGDILQVWVA